MRRTYNYSKNEFIGIKNLNYIKINFSNGDFIIMDKQVVINYQLEFYDNLVLFKNKIVPVVKGGFIKCKNSKRKQMYSWESNFSNEKEYKSNKKNCFTDRLTKINDIIEIAFIDSSGWDQSILGIFKTRLEDEYIYIDILPYPMELPSESCDFSITLSNVVRKNINKITLDFENTETIDIYDYEILALNLNFEKKLNWCASNFCREIKNGYIKIKLDKNVKHRECCFVDERTSHNYRNVMKRITGNKSKCKHDVCNLYISYNYEGNYNEERLIINDISESDLYYVFEGGYCETKGEVIIIYFGKKMESKLNIS